MKTTLFALAATLSFAVPALAHGDDKPRHGGQVVEVGETLFELVRTPAGVSLYLMEDGDEVPAAGMSAKMIVTSGAKRTEVPLAAAGGNRFIANSARVAPGSRVGVLVIDHKTQARQSANFLVK